MKYGYARVSTDGQSVDAQVRQLTKAGCKKVFRETASGANTDRAQLAKALAALDADDVLMVTRLDRLARSTRDLLNTLGAIADRKAGFKSLGDSTRERRRVTSQSPTIAMMDPTSLESGRRSKSLSVCSVGRSFIRSSPPDMIPPNGPE
jgi:DNA invertase Pin-like site-specific DNA recombinase